MSRITQEIGGISPMNKKGMPVAETLVLLLGEIAVAAVTVLVFFLFGHLSYRVFTGLALGCAAVLFNFLFLAFAVNRAVDAIMAERGDAPMDDEAAAAFAEKYKAQLQKRVQLSQAARTLAMTVVLILALVTDYFDVVATVIPLLSFRPLLNAAALMCNKKK